MAKCDRVVRDSAPRPVIAFAEARHTPRTTNLDRLSQLLPRIQILIELIEAGCGKIKKRPRCDQGILFARLANEWLKPSLIND